jgi:hypothetical protein
MSGQSSVVSDQEPLPPTPPPLGRFYPGSRGLQAESKAKRDRPPTDPPFREVQGGGTPWARGSGGNRHPPTDPPWRREWGIGNRE